ncbi:TraB/GumN family protein [Dokdonella soli]|uniref:TraB/GumN family protein n=1 Tax=Dokdonella soli TaxID=529810 RepID=A0ABP3U517_9GAMM
MRHAVLVCVLALSAPPSLFAQDAASESSAIASVTQLDTLVVSGVQPGPGMWKVSKGDHVLWVLGTLSPLPKKIEWQAHEVEAAIAQSQEVLASPEVAVSANVGFFGQLALLPSLIGIRKNPDDASLEQVVPPELYARWSVLKGKYIGRSNKVEKWRPIFAALELYEAALEKAGLADSGIVQKKVKAAAKRAHVVTTTPRVELVIDEPKATLKEFKSTPLNDLDCFRKTLDRIDTDLGTMTARANAWATGDLDALRKLPYTDQMTACRAAITEANLARKRGMTDVDTRIEKAWLDAASAALVKNQVTFAMLPIRHLLAADGYLSRLRTQGYAVEEPGALVEDGAETQSGTR